MPRYTLNEHNVFGMAPAIAESVTALTFPDDTPTDEQYHLINAAHSECIAVLRAEAEASFAAASEDVLFYSINDVNGIRFPIYVKRYPATILH
jgi:hypothetical protein